MALVGDAAGHWDVALSGMPDTFADAIALSLSEGGGDLFLGP